MSDIDTNQIPEGKVPLSAKLNLETAQIAWKDLQTFFAGGSVVQVEKGTDLILVAEQLAADNSELFSQWLKEGTVRVVPDEQALKWFDEDAVLWAVVIKPWVLVQD